MCSLKAANMAGRKKLCIPPVLLGASLTSPNPMYDPAIPVPRATRVAPRPVFLKRKTCYEPRQGR